MKIRKSLSVAVLSAIFATPAVCDSEPVLGEWDVSTEVDMMDDSVRTTASLWSEGGDVGLFVRCWGTETEVYVYWGRETLSNAGESVSVQYRLDADPANSSQWSVSRNKEATFMPSDTIYDFIESMATASRLIVRVSPPETSHVTDTFDLNGARWALMPVSEVCGWFWMLALADVSERSITYAFMVLSAFGEGEGDVRDDIEGMRPVAKMAADLLYDYDQGEGQ